MGAASRPGAEAFVQIIARANSMIAASVAGSSAPMPTEALKNRRRPSSLRAPSAVPSAGPLRGSRRAVARYRDRRCICVRAFALGWAGLCHDQGIPNGARGCIRYIVPRTRTYTVSALYHVGNERYDRLVVFLPIESRRTFSVMTKATRSWRA